MWHGCDKALTARGTPKKPQRVGFCRSFINEDKTLWVQSELVRTPFVTGLSDIRAVLFGGA
jgi:hypothetical protein